MSPDDRRYERRSVAVLIVAIAIATVGALNYALVRRCERKGMAARWIGKGVYCVER